MLEALGPCGDKLRHPPVIQGGVLRFYPFRQFGAAFAIQALARFPEVLQHMIDIAGMRGLREQFRHVALQIVIPVCDQLDARTPLRREPPLVRFAARDGPRVAA